MKKIILIIMFFLVGILTIGCNKEPKTIELDNIGQVRKVIDLSGVDEAIPLEGYNLITAKDEIKHFGQPIVITSYEDFVLLNGYPIDLKNHLKETIESRTTNDSFFKNRFIIATIFKGVSSANDLKYDGATLNLKEKTIELKFVYEKTPEYSDGYTTFFIDRTYYDIDNNSIAEFSAKITIK